ncbi:MAG: hypothetical protein RBT70_08300 [Alphaproteobacteria bacterium]|nr:hypothetical protein [Alphaproteobacteria bacterium]
MRSAKGSLAPVVDKGSPLIPIWMIGVLASILILLAVPALMARLIALPGDNLVLEMRQGKRLSKEQLDLAEQSRLRVIQWFPVKAYFNDLAEIALMRTVDVETTDMEAYKSVETWQHRALLLSPADPYGWFRLAHLYERAKAPVSAVSVAWWQSYAAAPYEPRLFLPRLEMAMRLGQNLGGEGRERVINNLIQDAWNYNPWDLTRSARDRTYLSLLNEAFRDDPDATARIDKILREQLD